LTVTSLGNGHLKNGVSFIFCWSIAKARHWGIVFLWLQEVNFHFNRRITTASPGKYSKLDRQKDALLSFPVTYWLLPNH
jgi:hypothetical protein